MATPISFPEANRQWVGPGDTGPLPSYTTEETVLSCWKLGWKERFYALFSGKAWLTVWGRQPGVNVTCEDPFGK